MSREQVCAETYERWITEDVLIDWSDRFTVREFTFDEQAMTNEREKMRDLDNERQKLYANLVRWLKINFAEVFSASIHVKAIRVFVESVLR